MIKVFRIYEVIFYLSKEYKLTILILCIKQFENVKNDSDDVIKIYAQQLRFYLK